MTARRNLLVVLLEEGYESQLRKAIAQRSDGDANVHVVAPLHVGPLEWLATDEDQARAEAEVRAGEAEWSLTGEAEVEGEAGESDPVIAVEDALHSFPADEILLVGGADQDGGLDRSLQQYGLPVTRLPDSAPVRERNALREAIRGLAHGRSRATPFALFALVNLAVLALAAVITLVVLLVLELR